MGRQVIEAAPWFIDRTAVSACAHSLAVQAAKFRRGYPGMMVRRNLGCVGIMGWRAGKR
jgi:hypothetical protein